VSRVLFITQQADPAHPALGATLPKIAALARRVDEVVVLAAGGAVEALPPTARLREFGARSRVGRGFRFAAALATELRSGRPLLVLAHMCPIYAVLAAPLVRPLRVPLLLWFTHWRPSRLLAAAERLSTAVLSVDVRSFPLESRKLVPIGHGIDVSEFSCGDSRDASERLRLVALGRYNPAKGYDTMLRGLRIGLDAGVDVQLAAFGPVLTAEDERHRQELGRLVDDLGLADRVSLGDAIPRRTVSEVLGGSDALLNATRVGSADKVVFEAAAACLPVVASAEAFGELVPPELRFRTEAELAAALRRLAGLPVAEREALGRRLRAGVEEHHSADSWANAVLDSAAFPQVSRGYD
jgi:glycosyltransferase involved in cell wall biosynthesis